MRATGAQRGLSSKQLSSPNAPDTNKGRSSLCSPGCDYSKISHVIEVPVAFDSDVCTLREFCRAVFEQHTSLPSSSVRERSASFEAFQDVSSIRFRKMLNEALQKPSCPDVLQPESFAATVDGVLDAVGELDGETVRETDQYSADVDLYTDAEHAAALYE